MGRLSRWVLCNHKESYKWKRETEKKSEILRCSTARFDGKRDHEPRSARNAALEGGKGKEMDSPLELL